MSLTVKVAVSLDDSGTALAKVTAAGSRVTVQAFTVEHVERVDRPGRVGDQRAIPFKVPPFKPRRRPRRPHPLDVPEAGIAPWIGKTAGSCPELPLRAPPLRRPERW